MFDITTYAQQAQALIDAGRFLYAQGWSTATSSNYSARIDESHIAITVSGRHKGQLSAGDIMVVDLDGRPVQCQTRPSAETLLHTELYRLFPETGAVLHTHSLGVTVLTMHLKGQDAVVFEGYELQKALTGQTTHEAAVPVRIFDNTQDIPELAAESRDWLAAHPDVPAYFIRGHGLYTWAKDMATCLRHVEALEFLVNCELERIRMER
ncbi:MAG: methylthioribulose 1-phosphate dehydratase [Gammaproteobacteria bacterium]|nr:MAG: methylthioribulose 1-phosphate dehydratase [Gammaproteobacteria bacterium]